MIVPAVCWSTTYFPLHQYGMKLKFVDIDRGDAELRSRCAGQPSTDETRAIMVVNLLGNPNDFDAIAPDRRRTERRTS